MKHLNTFFSLHYGLTRPEVRALMPRASEVLFENAEGITVCDPHSLMGLPDRTPALHPHVVIAEFDHDGQVAFVELRRSFAELKSAKAWAAELETRLIREGVAKDDRALERPLMRTTAHDGSLVLWRSWIVDDVSVATVTVRRLLALGGSSKAVATLSMAFSPWRDSFGPKLGEASHPHRPDEWDGWDTTADSILEQPEIDTVLGVIRSVIAADSTLSH